MTLSETQAGRRADESVMITAMSASWSGRHTFSPGDAHGLLPDALTEGTSTAESRRAARASLAKLRRLV